MADSRRRRRLAFWLWLALGLSVWNVIFDYEIRTAANRYLYLQGLHASGKGPIVSVDAIMSPARVRGAVIASVFSGAIVTAGLFALNFATRRPARS